MSQISDNPKADVDQAMLGFREGDPVKAIILMVNLEKERISFGLKPSYFGTDDDIEMHDAEPYSQDEDEAPVMEEIGNQEVSESDDDQASATLFLSHFAN